MSKTKTQYTTATKLQRIAWLSRQDSKKVFKCVTHHINEESLKACYYELDGKKAVGIDGVNKTSYGEELDKNLKELITRMKQMAYKPGNIRQVLIPKAGKLGATRPLGISNFEDKLVQKMMQKILESIYEGLFLECSYGFRPGRSCHSAIKDLRHHLYSKKVRAVIDVDLSNFFGKIDHKELINILKMKIEDQTFLRYVVRTLKSGILTKEGLKISEEGTAQGSPASPILANIFAHYVVDEWFEGVVKTHCKGEVKLFRYCDDICICCEYESDASRIKDALAKRLGKFKLEMNEEKTKLIKFDSEEARTSFNFLGFTFYWSKSRVGRSIPKVKTEGKRMIAKLKRVNQWAKENRNKYRLKELWKRLRIKLEGHIQYYGVSFNIKRVGTFIERATYIVFKWLNRRSQRKSFDWEKLKKFVKLNPLPRARVCHKLF